VEREGDVTDRDMQKLHVIAPSLHGKRQHKPSREYNKLINDGLRVYQEREQGGSAGGRGGTRQPEFYSMSPAGSKARPCPLLVVCDTVDRAEEVAQIATHEQPL
jgi:hypothetical protein